MKESFTSPTESKDTDDNSDKKPESSKDKKPSVNRRKIGTFTAKNVIEAPRIHQRTDERSSLWSRAIEAGTKKDKELSETADQSDEKVEKSKKIDAADVAIEKSVAEDSQDAIEKETPLENLGETEKHEVVLRVAEALEADASDESKENEEPEDEAVNQAKTAASAVFLGTVRSKIAENPDAPVEEILDEVEAELIEKIEVPEEAVEEGHEEPEESEEPTEGEIPLREDAPDEDEMLVIPRGGSSGSGTAGGSGGSGGGGAGGSSGGTGSSGGGSSSTGSGSTGGPAGPTGPTGPTGGGPVPPTTPGGPTPPFGGGYGGYPGPAGPGGTAPGGFNAAPAAGISMEDHNRIVHRQERIAIAQGLLVGGIVGYLIGRRRGRIKTERRLLPIQEKLEKQVVTLQNSVVEKEQKIRALAAEKAQTMATQQEREKFAARLTRDEAILSNAKTVQQERQRQKEKSPDSLVHSQPERFGRMAVESPAVVLSSAANLGRAEFGIESSKNTVITDKKVAAYTEPELKQAAEKIRIDGTTLKEMWDRGQLNERSVKRVMAEFVEGRSVRAAINQELLDEELRYERDPKLRDAARRRAQAGGSGVREPIAHAAGAAMLQRTLGKNGDAGAGGQDSVNSSTEDDTTRSSSKKQNKSLIDKARSQPKSHVVAAGAAVAALIAAILIFA
jgi:hypothetical protein